MSELTDVQKKDRDKLIKLCNEGRREEALEYFFQTFNIRLEAARLEAQLERNKSE